MKKNLLFSCCFLICLFVFFICSRIYSPVRAGSFSEAKVTISDSRAGRQGVSYALSFTATAETAIKELRVQFCTNASGTCTTPTGMVTTGSSISNDTISGTGRSVDTSTNGLIKTIVTTPATQSPLTLTYTIQNVTNPTTQNTTFYAIVTSYSDTESTVLDTASLGFAILDSTSITVNAQVESVFAVELTPILSGSVNGQTLNVADSTAASIPFGVLSAGTSKTAAHDLTVTTNAANGYQATVKAADPPLLDGENNIDSFTGINAVPMLWSSPNGSEPNTNTGFFGYTTNDSSLGTETADRFTLSGGNRWAGFSTTAQEIAYSSTSVISGETTRLGWQIEVNTTQPTGSYEGTIILVTTPTY